MKYLRQGFEAPLFAAGPPVESFLSAAQNNDPNLYPGQRPEGSYVTDGQNTYNVQVTAQGGEHFFSIASDQGQVDLDAFLQLQGVPRLNERIPIVAFGANMSPGSLASKFRKDVVRGEDGVERNNRPDLLVVPTVYGELADHDVVWSGGPGSNGNFTAVLYGGEKVQGTSVQVGINFLTPEQLLMLHATELNYDLAETTVSVAGAPIRAYYYVGTDSMYLHDGAPVAVSSIPAHRRRLPGASTRQLLEHVLADPNISAAVAKRYPEITGVTDATVYQSFIKTLKAPKGSGGTPRRDLQQFVQKQLAARGLVGDTGGQHGTASWANPSKLATYGQQKRGIRHNDLYQLPSQVLEASRWVNPAERNRVLKSIGEHLVRISGGKLRPLKKKG